MLSLDEVLTRGVEQILPDKKGLAALMAKKKIRLYQGFDPSSPTLHIGNFIGIRKLAQFQKLGHKVIFLIGDFTGMIGDPTDKSAARQKLSAAQVLTNLKDYKAQASKVLKFEGENAAEVKFNSEWLAKLAFADVIELASHFTVQQILERDFFQERLKANRPIYAHEFFYPLMQGYDSVMLDVDLEIGGNDQLFNMLAGRNLMADLLGKEKYVLALKLLADPTGKKMGKSEGNTINLNDSANEIFGKVMALPDAVINSVIELLTDLPLNFAEGKNPIEVKKAVAANITGQIHGKGPASDAMESFEKTFQKSGVPQDIKTVKIESATLPLLDAVFATGLVTSRSEAGRLITQNAVEVNGEVKADPTEQIAIRPKGNVLKIGKTRFAKLITR